MPPVVATEVEGTIGRVRLLRKSGSFASALKRLAAGGGS